MYKVLIVEDEDIIRKGLLFMVNWQEADCVVVGEAVDGLEGLEKIRETNPDIVVVDINMPVKDGLSMLEDSIEEYGYDAVFFILLILCFAWGGDTCAYFAGRAFGKHKLCPVVSPKKTVEGAIGGVLGTMVFGVAATLIYSIAADRMEAFTRSNIGVSMYVVIALLACVAAVLGIYGDLFASVVKRQCGIKDYGTIFPGHGGILDRFDSVMFIAPFVTMVITAVFYQ